ncbi:MAG: hypothetical protein QOG80_1161, partial [Pseudonocardiales bacterium]|nr:hypothetical protein [Pseudonocardiales bacterium]
MFTLHGALRTAAERETTAPALVTADERWTYGQLATRAGQVAAALLELGIQPGDRVAVAADKSPASVAALYGVMAAGAAYVPVDPYSPPLRATRIIEDAGCRIVCADAARAQVLRSAGATGLRMLGLEDGVEQPDVSADDVAGLEPASLTRGCESDLAYLLYTSGSTGAPKGVMLSHRNALAFVDWAVWRFNITHRDRLSSHAPFHFDLSVFDLYGAARAGASLRILPSAEAMFGRSMTAVIDTDKLTVWYSVPSALVMLVGSATAEELASLRVILFAGEVFATKHLRRLRDLVPAATLANLYGPTETNVCTYWVSPATAIDDGPIPIGRACENQEVFVLSDALQPAADGEVGELWVRGPTVMQGYFGDAERTARTRRQHPLHDRFPDPCYRTGDLVRVEANGNLAFLGRRDHQVKTRGYRVELGEI